MLLTLPDPEERFAAIREILRTRDRDISFDTEPAFAAEVAAVGLWREIGTPNDQISSQVVVHGTDAKVPLDAARADLVEYRGNVGVRIRYAEHDRLECKRPGVASLLHPSLSFDADGTVRQIVVFPLSVARIAKREGAELVVVPSWALDLSFGGSVAEREYHHCFGHPEKWDEVRRWIDHFCALTEAHRIPFFTSHDFSAHIAGFEAESWDLLATVALRIRTCVAHVFGGRAAPPMQALVLPFMVTYLLDGLAQPIHGGTDRILVVIDALLDAIAAPAFGVGESVILRRFPSTYWRVLQQMHDAPTPLPASFRDEIRARIDDVIGEMRRDLSDGVSLADAAI